MTNNGRIITNENYIFMNDTDMNNNSINDNSINDNYIKYYILYSWSQIKQCYTYCYNKYYKWRYSTEHSDMLNELLLK